MFPYWSYDGPRIGKRRYVLLACSAAAVLVAILASCNGSGVRLRFDDWARKRTRDAHGETYEAPVTPEPVVFDVDGVRIGDALDQVLSHNGVIPEEEAKGKTSGMLATRKVTLVERYMLFGFYFNDGKLIAIGVAFLLDLKTAP